MSLVGNILRQQGQGRSPIAQKRIHEAKQKILDDYCAEYQHVSEWQDDNAIRANVFPFWINRMESFDLTHNNRYYVFFTDTLQLTEFYLMTGYTVTDFYQQTLNDKSEEMQEKIEQLSKAFI